MISIIISSANPDQLNQVSANIKDTIGVDFEIIGIDNSSGQQGICAVYNQGAKEAKYDILCFMHEDIIIKTKSWGAVLEAIFDNNTDVGLIGVAGGSYKPITPSGWGGIGINNAYYNFIQSFKYSNKEPELIYRNPDNEKLAKVACVDGMFLATTKTVFSKYKFDEVNFTGFHIYDLDYSITVGQEYKVCVTYEILMNHLSEGSYNPKWMDDTLKLHRKFAQLLPINVGNFTFEQCRYIEKSTFKDFIKNLIRLKLPPSIAFDVLKNKKYKDFKLSWKLKYYVVKMYLQKRGLK